MVTSSSKTAASLQLAGAVIDNLGVPVTVGVSVARAYGVRVAGKVAVTNTGVALGGVGAESVTWQALSAAAATSATKDRVRIPAF